MQKVQRRFKAIPFIAPFVVFVLLLGFRSYLPFAPKWEYPARVIVVSGLMLITSRKVIAKRILFPLQSTLLGLLVFVVWVGPDLLWPSYRHHWLFQNSLTGSPQSSLNPFLHSDVAFLVFRIFGTAVLVPIIEELFWRGWLMRYLIKSDFEEVPLGTYSRFSFWVTALLFASEHGSYWDVGLLAGASYNWCMLRTKSLADCMLAHAVTNACLAVYVVGFDRWQYWL